MTTSTTERLEIRVGQLLRASSVASTTLLALGLIVAIARPSLDPQMYLLRSGIGILLAGPIGRVALSAGSYARAREWSSAGLALAVFTILTVSAVIALQTGP